MKGVVFTEFLSLVDDNFGEETTERVVASCPLASGGVYTAVGTYDPGELKALVGALSTDTAISPDELQRLYGFHLFSRFGELYPALLEGYQCPAAFIAAVGPVIHREVHKLYPEAELPDIRATAIGEEALTVNYRSRRDLPHFCRGLLQGCLGHFATAGSVSPPKPVSTDPPTYEFTLRIERS
jgi:hypothetical protein